MRFLRLQCQDDPPPHARSEARLYVDDTGVLKAIGPDGTISDVGGAGGAGTMTLTDLSDVTGSPGPNKAPVYDANTGVAPLTEVTTQDDLDAILAQVVWHRVNALAGDWQPSNPSAVLTPDGVAFGPYADGAASGGSLRYFGLNGQPFSAVKNLAYCIRYIDDHQKDGGGPYLRVWMRDTAGNEHDAIFTPGSQDWPGFGEGPLQEYVATSGTWRYDSDDGSNSEFGTGVPLAEVLAKYGDQPITKMAITLGWTAGDNLRGLLRWWQINSDAYLFTGSTAVEVAGSSAAVAAPLLPHGGGE